ncbi:hypothetical protein FRC04_008467 [Tulasnella sp. 424]|nr:hypothetical protein FRC04_008467 [Tulasnella sp. 424]KAG8973948.1 hypothetical protein FRC05_008005 [Tulasnella sp. 425]
MPPRSIYRQQGADAYILRHHPYSGTPTDSLSLEGSLIYLAMFRILLNVDSPMSATITCDRANLRVRGTIVIGVSLVPAFGTLYQRLTLSEATRSKKSRPPARPLANEEYAADNLKKKNEASVSVPEQPQEPSASSSSSDIKPSESASISAPPQENKPRQIGECVAYFSEWRHFKILLGTCMRWFLLDIAFRGINLNQNVALQQIGFDGHTGSTAWEKLYRLAEGNIIKTALGFVPGYYATILTVERLGKKKIQLMGFWMEAFFQRLIYPSEVFPTRFKAFAHGMSAACGKAWAIISALVFNTLSKVGTPAILWIFFACSIADAGFTLLLPEAKMRDADLVYEEEEKKKRRLQRTS